MQSTDPHPVAGKSSDPIKTKTLGRRLRRLALWSAGFVFVLIVAGIIYQAVASTIDSRRYPPPGQLIDVGGHRLHYHTTGEGPIPVILEAGGGGWSLHWSRVQPEVAKFAQVLAYDRAGMGWSEPSGTPRTSHQIAEELHSLLHAASIPGPYALVGHSAGGYYVRMFAHLYPEEVAGLVLVDPSNEERTLSLTEQQRHDIAARGLRQGYWRSALAYVGFVRLYVACAPPESLSHDSANLTENERLIELALAQRPTHLLANAQEGAGNLESAEQMRDAGNLKDLPLRLLTAERDDPNSPGMESRLHMHERLTHLSSRGRHVTVPQSGHFIHLDQPEAVVQAIREVLDEARRAKR